MKYATLILLTFTVNFAVAQNSQGNQLFAQGKYSEAAEAYSKQLEDHPNDSLALFGLARVALQQENWKEASSYLSKAQSAGYPKAETHYYSAKRELYVANNDAAMADLKKGVENGMRHYIPLTQDPLFKPLQSRDDWNALITKAEINTYPCLSSESYRALDFWLGHWEVFSNNIKVGENVISRANGGCAIHESYTTFPRDYTGQSINFYDPLEKRWHQHWVGSGGDVTNYLESDKGDGMLQFTGESLTGQGSTVKYRMTFTKLENGDVRQFIEASSDQGESWTTAFDGLYKLKQGD